jgi:tetratricopeptide (TPR) repeat protein
VLAGHVSREERQRFWLLARAAGTVDSTIAALEKALEATPDDAGARMRLADGYISKLFLVPAGPEKGIWAAKAEQQWSAVLARDERNWDARFALAFDYSQYPEFLNKAPDSIREFETLRRFQEQGTPEPRQAQVYVQLSSLYKRQAQADKARQVLEAGLARHPDDAEITKALESMRK